MSFWRRAARDRGGQQSVVLDGQLSSNEQGKLRLSFSWADLGPARQVASLSVLLRRCCNSHKLDEADYQSISTDHLRPTINQSHSITQTHLLSALQSPLLSHFSSGAFSLSASQPVSTRHPKHFLRVSPLHHLPQDDSPLLHSPRRSHVRHVLDARLLDSRQQRCHRRRWR